jgi:hypothetical protein
MKDMTRNSNNFLSVQTQNLGLSKTSKAQSRELVTWKICCMFHTNISEEYYFCIDLLSNVACPWVLKYAGTNKELG